jgi:hypothetical protein
MSPTWVPTPEHLRMWWDLTWTLAMLAASGVVCRLSWVNLRNYLHPDRATPGRTAARAVSGSVLVAAALGMIVLILVVPT